MVVDSQDPMLKWCPGLKTESDEVEKFTAANCQEVAQDKWLCPLR